MPVTKLIVEYDYSFDLYGIISSAKEYKLAWSVNKLLNTNLAKHQDLDFQFLSNGIMYISNFQYDAEYDSIRLLKNRSVEFENVPKPFLIPELKQFDYFMQVHRETDAYVPELVLDKLRKASTIQFINTLDTQKLQSKDNLIY